MHDGIKYIYEYKIMMEKLVKTNFCISIRALMGPPDGNNVHFGGKS